MLISFDDLYKKYNMRISQVVHVGAHLAEEADEYARCGDPRVLWVEANHEVMPKIQEKLRHYPNQKVVQALVTDKDDDVRPFNITNYDGMSSSVFQFDRHPIYSPDTVFVDQVELRTTTIDTLCRIFNMLPEMLCLDIQGAELLALNGAWATLEFVDYVYTEVSTASVYAGGAQMHEIDDFLGKFSLERVETDLGMHGGTHGDAFYVRR